MNTKTVEQWYKQWMEDHNKSGVCTINVLDMLKDFAASQFKHPVPDEAGLYSRKQLEDAHIVGYRKGRLADKDSDSVYQDAKNYAATIHPSQPEGDGWVSVEDRLPEDNETVLVTNGKRVKEVWFGQRTKLDKPDFRFTTMPSDTITHWMPLPSLPNK